MSLSRPTSPVLALAGLAVVGGLLAPAGSATAAGHASTEERTCHTKLYDVTRHAALYDELKKVGDHYEGRKRFDSRDAGSVVQVKGHSLFGFAFVKLHKTDKPSPSGKHTAFMTYKALRYAGCLN